MPVYQIIIEVEDPNRKNGLIDHIEYIESNLLIEAANRAVEYTEFMDGELKCVRYAIPTPTKA